MCGRLSLFALAAVTAGSPVPLGSEKRAALREQLAAVGHFVDDTDEAVRAFLTPASIHVVGPNASMTNSNASTAGIDPSQIWQIGKTLWQLVQNNKPVENLSDSWAGAVPVGISNWTSLSNWQVYTSPEYEISFVNFLGVTLTDFKWVFSFKHHGDYHGIGKYVTQAGASVNKAYALLSEHLDVSVNAFKPLNYGTTTGPLAGVDVQIKLSSYGSFEKTTVGCHVTMKGDGSLTEVTCDKGKHHC